MITKLMRSGIEVHEDKNMSVTLLALAGERLGLTPDMTASQLRKVLLLVSCVWNSVGLDELDEDALDEALDFVCAQLHQDGDAGARELLEYIARRKLSTRAHDSRLVVDVEVAWGDLGLQVTTWVTTPLTSVSDNSDVDVMNLICA
jgi:hypothetical protein